MSSIEVRQLTVRRDSGFVLGPLDFTLAAGSRTAVVGPSGCGKTTLLRCLAGLQAPDAGTVALGGRVASDPRRPLPPAARRIGFVFQDGGLWPHMTAAQHVRFANPALDAAGARALLEQVQLGARADQRPGALSGGEAQRLALARALAGGPGILMLDEPLHSVDAALRGQLALLIRRIAADRGLTVVLVTHDSGEAQALADDLMVMKAGRILESGAAAELVRAPRTAFGAAFLAGAVCVPVAANGADAVHTMFGPVSCPRHGDAAHALVLLPGEVVVAADGPAEALVVSVQRGMTGCRALLDLAGHALAVACAPDVRAGTTVRLALAGAPRVLPIDPAEERDPGPGR